MLGDSVQHRTWMWVWLRKYGGSRKSTGGEERWLHVCTLITCGSRYINSICSPSVAYITDMLRIFTSLLLIIKFTSESNSRGAHSRAERSGRGGFEVRAQHLKLQVLLGNLTGLLCSFSLSSCKNWWFSWGICDLSRSSMAKWSWYLTLIFLKAPRKLLKDEIRLDV